MTSPTDADPAETPDEESISIDAILDVVEQIMELDERRQRTFRGEVDADANRFVETHAIIADERDQLDRLDEHLAVEAEHLDDLVEGTEYLSTDQAVRHRDRSVEKIRAHNRALARFHAEMDVLLETIETNLDRIESDGDDAELADSHEHLEAAIVALRDHNDSVEGLEKNLRILHAYLR
jgi:hypothetical protein